MPNSSDRQRDAGGRDTSGDYPSYYNPYANPYQATGSSGGAGGGGGGVPIYGGGSEVGAASPSLTSQLGPWIKGGLGVGALLTTLARGNSNPSDGLSQLFQALPQLRQLLDLQTSQAQRADPLHAALVQLSMNLLPKSSRAAFPGVPTVAPSPSSPSAPTATLPHPNRRSDLV